MKADYILYAGIALSMSFVSCEDKSPYLGQDWQLSVDGSYNNNKDDKVYEFSVDKKQISIACNVTSADFTITTNDNWQASTTCDWIISISPNSGNTTEKVNVTFSENTTGTDRSGVITITGKDKREAEINVIQSGTSNISFDDFTEEDKTLD